MRLQELLRQRGDIESLEEADKLKSKVDAMEEDITDLLRVLRRRKYKKRKGKVETTLPEEAAMEALVLDEIDMECAICVELMDEDIAELECHHKYHRDCVNEWIAMCRFKKVAPTCPKCRGDVMI